MKRLYVIAASILVMFIASILVSAQPAAPHIVNADFEQGVTEREAPEVRVAIGWDYDYLPEGRWCEYPCKRPEFTEEDDIVFQGNYSQRWFATFARSFGTISQRVDVEAGQWYEFSCQVYAISEPDGQQAAFVGIQPWGGGVFERVMLWGEQQPWGSYREWNRVSVTAQAFGNRIRVAVGSNNNWATHNNAMYVDSCEIRKVDIAGPTSTPYPTLTPCPTPQPCPTCIPGSGCSCTAIQEIVETVVAGRDPVRWP